MERKDDILCYHSRFIQKDRSRKEEKIFELENKDESCLLVATQVAEVSLDIDFDILFTENAPIDAIIQRAGMINRKRRKEGSKVIVFKHSETSEKFIYNLPGILKRTFTLLRKKNGERLNESHLLQMVNEVYEGIEIETNEEFKNGLTRYQKIQNDLHQILDLVSSDEVFTRWNINAENIIPDIFQEKLAGASIMEKAKHEVSVSQKRLHTIKTNSDEEHGWFKYADVLYDFETGLKFKHKQLGTSMGNSNKANCL